MKTYSAYQMRRRRQWERDGKCYECGGVRKPPTARCELCLLGNANRSNRSYWKKRMAKAALR